MKTPFLGCTVVFLFILTSCSNNLKFFNNSIQQKYNWSNSELKKIQFYLSEDIVLWRELEGKNADIEDGVIKVKNNRKVEQVKIKKGTPGTVVIIPKKNRLAVSFDSNPSKYLIFGPNKRRDGIYSLLAKKWNRNSGIITYNGKQYSTDNSSALASLMVNIDRAKKTVYKSEKAQGRKVK